VPFPVLRFRRAGALALAAALAVAGLAACGGDDDDRAGGVVELSDDTVPAEGPGIRLDAGPAGRRVAMIGDSITVGSTPGLEAAADALGIELTIDAEVGRRMTVGRSPDSGTDAIADVLDEVGAPDLWVIALGTNDVGQYGDDEYAAQIESLLALLPADAPVIWIDVFVRDRADESVAFNEALTAVLRERGDASIGDWLPTAEEDGVLSDGIHPSDDGRGLFVDLVTTQIRNWLA